MTPDQKENERLQMKRELRELGAVLRRELRDYVKARRVELRKRPACLKKDSDICVDRLRSAFENFVVFTHL